MAYYISYGQPRSSNTLADGQLIGRIRHLFRVSPFPGVAILISLRESARNISGVTDKHQVRGERKMEGEKMKRSNGAASHGRKNHA
jgi:hypothetical protein